MSGFAGGVRIVYDPALVKLGSSVGQFEAKRETHLVDLSKLPRLSNSDRPPAPEPIASQAAEQIPAAPGSVGVPNQPSTERTSNMIDSWLSVAIGVILILITPRIWQYLFSKLFGSQFTWTFSDPSGNPLPYGQTVFFWGDIAFASFTVSMILEGLVIAIARRPVTICAALALTLLATLFNLGYVGYMMQQGYGFQIYSGLAVAFGAYIAMYEFQLLRSLRRGQ